VNLENEGALIAFERRVNPHHGELDQVGGGAL
jgi:hypothetical protein